jgi:hypothetical protein
MQESGLRQVSRFENFHDICSLFSIRYRPGSRAAASPSATLVVGRFMQFIRPFRLASFPFRARPHNSSPASDAELGSFRRVGKSPSETAPPAFCRFQLGSFGQLRRFFPRPPPASASQGIQVSSVGKQNSEYPPFVGQPILAAAGFQLALFGDRKRSPAPKKSPERRLQGKIGCPTKQARFRPHCTSTQIGFAPSRSPAPPGWVRFARNAGPV